MGKASRKLGKQQQKKNEQNKERAFQEMAEKCRAQIKEEKYDEALATLAEIAQTGQKNADMMYLAAVCYFMTGDYERAATWINNTLTYDGGHIRGRVLLARVCLVQDRDEDGLAIFDFVLEYGLATLNVEEKQEIEEILEYYVRNEAEKIKAHYPHIASFMNLEPSTEDNQQVSFIASEESGQPVGNITPVQDEVGGVKEDAMSAWETRRQAVLDKPISLAEKLRLLNSFAGAAYYERDFAGAQLLLEAALSIDAMDGESLCNMAILQAERGDKGLALEYVSKMKATDFGLLYQIREI